MELDFVTGRLDRVARIGIPGLPAHLGFEMSHSFYKHTLLSEVMAE